MKFDGRDVASRMSEELKTVFAGSARRCGLCILQVGGDGASTTFVGLKIKKGLELGVQTEHVRLEEGDYEGLLRLIEEKNRDPGTDGVMVQMPAVGIEREKVEEALLGIDVKKDADGQNSVSGVRMAVMRAVEIAYKEYLASCGRPRVAAVLGAKGYLGRKLVAWFGELGVECVGLDVGDDISRLKSSDLVVSCTGQSGVLLESQLGEKTGVIDLGASVAEYVDEGLSKDRFVTPVPGGIGPVTVASLYLNLADLVFGPVPDKIR